MTVRDLRRRKEVLAIRANDLYAMLGYDWTDKRLNDCRFSPHYDYWMNLKREYSYCEKMLERWDHGRYADEADAEENED